MDSNFKRSLEFILQSEGGYVNNPTDRGGETNMGIAKKFYPDEDIKNLTVERVGEIYRRDYWDKVRGDDLPSGVDYVIFDSAINHGPKQAGFLLQRGLNRVCSPALEVDGIIGPQTLQLCETGGDSLVREILREREIFYRKIVARDSSQEVFMKGWLNRLAQISVNVKAFQIKEA